MSPAPIDRRGRWATLAVLTLGLLVFLPPEVFPARQPIGDYRVFDNSWRYVMSADWHDGRVAGRDFVINQGFLFQALHAIGYHLGGFDTASMIRFWGLGEALVMLPALWLALWLSGGCGRWRRGTFLAWLLLAAAPTEFHATHLKPMGGLLPVLAGAYLLELAQRSGGGRALAAAAAAWGLAPPLLALYSFEIGVMTALAEAATAAVLVGLALGAAGPTASRLRRHVLVLLAAAVVGGGLYAAPALFSARWRETLAETLALTASYGYGWAAGGTLGGLLLLALPLGAAAVVLVFLGARLRAGLRLQVVDGPTLVVLTAACYAAAFIRYGITRSDVYHVWRAVAPAAFVYGCLLPSYLHPAAARAGLIAVWPRLAGRLGLADGVGRNWLARALVVAALVPFALTSTFNAGWKIRLAAWLAASPARARVEIVDPRLAEITEAARNLPGQWLLVWPYGTLFNVLAEKRNASYTCQAIEAHNPRLERAAIRYLEGLGEVPVLVYTDARPADGVPLVARTPRLLEYLLGHYALAAPPRPGRTLLAPHAPAEPRWQRRPLGLAPGPRSFEPGGDRGLEIGLADGDCRASDLLILKLRATPTPMYGFGKPGLFAVILVLDSGQQIVCRVPLPSDGQVHEVLVSGLDVPHACFPALFSRDNVWRSTERVAAVQLGWTPLDLLSRRPAQITLEGIERLERREPATVESSLAAEPPEGIWRGDMGAGPSRGD